MTDTVPPGFGQAGGGDSPRLSWEKNKKMDTPIEIMSFVLKTTRNSSWSISNFYKKAIVWRNKARVKATRSICVSEFVTLVKKAKRLFLKRYFALTFNGVVLVWNCCRIPAQQGILRVDEMRRWSMTAVCYIPGERALDRSLQARAQRELHVIMPESEPW